jgi:phosphoribosylanthranilate isomerase
MNVKVCGLRNRADILSVAQSGANYVGFNFYPRSVRYALPSLDPSLCAALGKVYPGVMKTGVFVNAGEEEVFSAMALYSLDAVQFHGDESPEYCSVFSREIKVIKAIQVNSDTRFEALKKYEESCSMFLFDTASLEWGGSGIKFNWNLLQNYRLELPFLLAGGIAPGDEEELKKLNHPKLAGVDINSRFEILPAQKNCGAIAQFISQLNYANAPTTH